MIPALFFSAVVQPGPAPEDRTGTGSGTRVSTAKVSAVADPDEQDLIRRLRQGQEWAFDTLVKRYEDRLLKIAYGITLDREEAREIVQDAFVSAIKNISGFRGDSGLGTWLRKITVNLCLNWKRKWKRRFRWHHTSLDTETEYLTREAAGSSGTPETRLGEKQQEAALAAAVQSLPENVRVVFVLNTVEGLSYQAIGEELGIKEGTVSSRLYRARQMILAAMKENGGIS